MPSNLNWLQWSSKTSPFGKRLDPAHEGQPRLDAQSMEIELALDQRQAAQVNAILMQQIERHEHQLAFVRVAGAHLGHQPAAKEQAAREAAEERARVAALPSTRLMNGYRFFAHVQWCRDVARHVYIRDVEFQRAQTAIKAFEKQTKKEDATMNTDAVWQDALQSIQGYIAPRRANEDGQDNACQNSLQQLFTMSPTPVYSIQKP